MRVGLWFPGCYSLIFVAGGGPYKPPKMTKEHGEVLEILGAAGSGLQSEFDCDAAGKSIADSIEIVELTADMQEALQNVGFLHYHFQNCFKHD